MTNLSLTIFIHYLSLYWVGILMVARFRTDTNYYSILFKSRPIDYLSESEAVTVILFRYIRKVLTSELSIEMNFDDPDVLELSKIYKKVTREEERMRQFVRFQKTVDGIFFAVMNPVYPEIPDGEKLMPMHLSVIPRQCEAQPRTNRGE
ncbi:MAG: DUF4130 domain-containing protein [Dysgonamonadaceae bacterium]|nr:DUF4130 domain-containing protein [Dysgonamonadaceae bacterium]